LTGNYFYHFNFVFCCFWIRTGTSGDSFGFSLNSDLGQVWYGIGTMVQWSGTNLEVWFNVLDMFLGFWSICFYMKIWFHCMKNHQIPFIFTCQMQGHWKITKRPLIFSIFILLLFFIKVKHVLIIANPWALIYSHGFYNLMILIWSQSSYSLIFCRKVLVFSLIFETKP
jgi:hypothetical protein